MLRLVGTDGIRFHSWPLRPGEYRIGRSSDSDFVINDGTVSRTHAILKVESDGNTCFITDQNSYNGTLVNGERITESIKLKVGDQLVVGVAEFKVCPDSGGSSISRPRTTKLAENDPEKSVFLSLNQASKPLPAKVADLPQVLPTLFELAKILVLPEPQEEMLEYALKLVNRVIPAERLAVLTTTDNEQELATAACLLPGGKDPGEFSLSRTIVGEILDQKNSILIDPHDDPKFARQESIIRSHIGSAMAVPLFDGGVVLGILYLDTTNPMHQYNDDYLHLLATFGNLIASRLLNYELMRERHEKEIFAAELRRASSIQRNLLARDIPQLPGYDVHAFQEQCRMVGGDLYDLAKLPDGRLVFVVADVSGKGMGGALLMSNILASFRILYEDPNLELIRVVKQVSRQLFNYSAPEDFATVYAGIIDARTNRLTYINAGHNPPLLVRKGGSVQHLEPSGTMIGAFDFSDWQEETVELEPGDLVLVFTDGVVEADRDGAHYGDERLEQLAFKVRDKSCCNVIESIVEDVVSFVEDSPRSDDITMLAIKRM